MFSRRELRIAGKTVEDVDNMAFEKEVDTMMNYTAEYEKTAGSNQFVYPHHTEDGKLRGDQKSWWQAWYADDSTPPAIVYEGHGNTSTGTGRRFDRTIKSKEIHLLIPLRDLFNFHRDYNNATTNLPFEWTFYIKPDAELFIKRNNTIVDGKLNWVNSGIEIVMPTLDPNSQAKTKLLKWIADKKEDVADFENTSVRYKTHADTNSINFDVSGPSGTQISKMIVGLKLQANITNQATNSATFSNLDVLTCHSTLNSTRVPDMEWVMDEDASNWTDAYDEMLRVSGMFNTPSGTYSASSIMDYSTFGDSPFFVFDFRNTTKQPVSDGNSNNLTFTAKLRVNQTNFNAYAIIYYHKQVKLNFESGVVTNVLGA